MIDYTLQLGIIEQNKPFIHNCDYINVQKLFFD